MRKYNHFSPASLSLFRLKKVVQHLPDLVGRADIGGGGLPAFAQWDEYVTGSQLWRKGWALTASPFVQASENIWGFRHRTAWVFVFANNNNEVARTHRESSQANKINR